jgi:hypothetical protein
LGHGGVTGLSGRTGNAGQSPRTRAP